MAKSKPSMETILISAFVGVESAHAFSAFEPSVFTIQGLVVPQEQEYMIRRGYIPSVAFSTILGSVVAALVKSKLPILFGLGTSVFMIVVYETAIRTAPVPTPATTPTPAPAPQINSLIQPKNYGIVVSKVLPAVLNPQSR